MQNYMLWFATLKQNNLPFTIEHNSRLNVCCIFSSSQTFSPHAGINHKSAESEERACQLQDKKDSVNAFV